MVYHCNYLKFFERARTERLRSLGFEQDDLRERKGIVFVVRSIQVEFIKPARFNDALRITADFAEVRRASLTFEQRIGRETDSGTLICTGSVRVACLSAGSFSPCPIPDDILQRIKDDA